MTQHFYVDPDPPVAGTMNRVCWTGPVPATATASWDPEGSGPESFSFTEDARCVDYEIGPGASSVVFHDDAGDSVDLARVVK